MSESQSLKDLYYRLRYGAGQHVPAAGLLPVYIHMSVRNDA